MCNQGDLATKLKQEPKFSSNDRQRAFNIKAKVTQKVQDLLDSEGQAIGSDDSQVVVQKVYNEALAVLRDAYGPDAQFKTDQFEAIWSIAKYDVSIVNEKTGWGKSLVYFLTTKLLRKDSLTHITLIISPLIELMLNQIESAKKLGLRGERVTPSINFFKLFKQYQNGELDFIITSPESLFLCKNSLFWQLLKNVSLLVLDEAHCVSTWGHDFRPQYSKIGNILPYLSPQVKVLCTSATLNKNALYDLVEMFLDKSIFLLQGDLVRDNLQITCKGFNSEKDKFSFLLKLIRRFDKSGIVYCNSKRDCNELALFLNCNGISAFPYHNDLEESFLNEVMTSFSQNKIKVLVSTIKLGMGYDKPDVGFVINFSIPDSMGSYYQQIGRAGRDLPIAFCSLLYSIKDLDFAKYRLNVNNKELNNQLYVYLCYRFLALPFVSDLVLLLSGALPLTQQEFEAIDRYIQSHLSKNSQDNVALKDLLHNYIFAHNFYASASPLLQRNQKQDHNKTILDQQLGSLFREGYSVITDQGPNALNNLNNFSNIVSGNVSKGYFNQLQALFDSQDQKRGKSKDWLKDSSVYPHVSKGLSRAQYLQQKIWDSTSQIALFAQHLIHSDLQVDLFIEVFIKRLFKPFDQKVLTTFLVKCLSIDSQDLEMESSEIDSEQQKLEILFKDLGLSDLEPLYNKKIDNLSVSEVYGFLLETQNHVIFQFLSALMQIYGLDQVLLTKLAPKVVEEPLQQKKHSFCDVLTKLNAQKFFDNPQYFAEFQGFFGNLTSTNFYKLNLDALNLECLRQGSIQDQIIKLFLVYAFLEYSKEVSKKPGFTIKKYENFSKKQEIRNSLSKKEQAIFADPVLDSYEVTSYTINGEYPFESKSFANPELLNNELKATIGTEISNQTFNQVSLELEKQGTVYLQQLKDKIKKVSVSKTDFVDYAKNLTEQDYLKQIQARSNSSWFTFVNSESTIDFDRNFIISNLDDSNSLNILSEPYFYHGSYAYNGRGEQIDLATLGKPLDSFADFILHTVSNQHPLLNGPKVFFDPTILNLNHQGKLELSDYMLLQLVRSFTQVCTLQSRHKKYLNKVVNDLVDDAAIKEIVPHIDQLLALDLMYSQLDTEFAFFNQEESWLKHKDSLAKQACGLFYTLYKVNTKTAFGKHNKPLVWQNPALSNWQTIFAFDDKNSRFKALDPQKVSLNLAKKANSFMLSAYQQELKFVAKSLNDPNLSALLDATLQHQEQPSSESEEKDIGEQNQPSDLAKDWFKGLDLWNLLSKKYLFGYDIISSLELKRLFSINSPLALLCNPRANDFSSYLEQVKQKLVQDPDKMFTAEQLARIKTVLRYNSLCHSHFGSEVWNKHHVLSINDKDIKKLRILFSKYMVEFTNLISMPLEQDYAEVERENILQPSIESIKLQSLYTQYDISHTAFAFKQPFLVDRKELSDYDYLQECIGFDVDNKYLGFCKRLFEFTLLEDSGGGQLKYVWTDPAHVINHFSFDLDSMLRNDLWLVLFYLLDQDVPKVKLLNNFLKEGKIDLIEDLPKEEWAPKSLDKDKTEENNKNKQQKLQERLQAKIHQKIEYFQKLLKNKAKLNDLHISANTTDHLIDSASSFEQALDNHISSKDDASVVFSLFKEQNFTPVRFKVDASLESVVLSPSYLLLTVNKEDLNLENNLVLHTPMYVSLYGFPSYEYFFNLIYNPHVLHDFQYNILLNSLAEHIYAYMQESILEYVTFVPQTVDLGFFERLTQKLKQFPKFKENRYKVVPHLITFNTQETSAVYALRQLEANFVEHSGKLFNQYSFNRAKNDQNPQLSSEVAELLKIKEAMSYKLCQYTKNEELWECLEAIRGKVLLKIEEQHSSSDKQETSPQDNSELADIIEVSKALGLSPETNFIEQSEHKNPYSQYYTEVSGNNLYYGDYLFDNKLNVVNMRQLDYPFKDQFRLASQIYSFNEELIDNKQIDLDKVLVIEPLLLSGGRLSFLQVMCQANQVNPEFLFLI